MFRTMASEGRLSIRESLRIFAKVEKYLEKTPGSSFEALCIRAKQGSMQFETDRSCGNTMMGFAAMFLAKEQTHRRFIDSLVNGSPLFCLLSNPNVVLHSLKPSNSSANQHGSNRDKDYFFLAKAACKYSSAYGFSTLKEKLLEYDPLEELPRVLFCSLTWFSPSHWVAYTENDECSYFRDHKFTVVKHSNERYQLLQGYSPSPHDTATLTENRSLAFFGYDTRAWMLSGHKYSSRIGFNRACMTDFLSHLQLFAEGNSFDPLNYEAMFGVHVDVNRWLGEFKTPISSRKITERHRVIEGKPVNYLHIPSLSHRELVDNDIVGCGTRDMAHSIESYL